jgi:hypothetical protein
MQEVEISATSQIAATDMARAFGRFGIAQRVSQPPPPISHISPQPNYDEGYGGGYVEAMYHILRVLRDLQLTGCLLFLAFLL